MNGRAMKLVEDNRKVYIYIYYPTPSISSSQIWNFFFFFVFCPFRAIPTAYGDSQARGRIGAEATGLHQSCSNSGSELRLRPTPQLMAMPDPRPTEQGRDQT